MPPMPLAANITGKKSVLLGTSFASALMASKTLLAEKAVV